MMRMRATRSAIARVERPLRIAGDREEVEQLYALGKLAVDARAAEGAMQRWLERPLPGDARLLAGATGTAVLADILLPPVWDFETDLVVLVGRDLAPVADVVASVGQRRVVVFGATAEDAAATGAIAVASVDEACAAVRTMVPGPPGQVVVRASLATDKAFADDVVSALRDVLGDLRIHRNTVHAFSRTWLEQGLANLPAIAHWPSIARLDDAFTGVPMVIVAPGPSLARNVEQLRGLRGRAIITAFSHSLKPVLAAGVTPDLVVTVDPQDVRYHFAGCDLSQTCLINAATVHPSLFELPAPRFLTLSANSAIDDWLFAGTGESAIVPGGGSVATTAFSLALRWRCDPIVFVGLDLSFPGGAYYVSSSSDGNARATVDDRGLMRVEGWSHAFRTMKAAGGPAAVAERAVELPGWSGGSVPSSFMFAMFHRWFVERMREVTGVTVYNCTEGGARIEGMDHRPLADVVPRLATTVDVAAAIDAHRGNATRPEHVREYFRAALRGLRRCRRLAKRARRLIRHGVTDHRLAEVESSLAAALRPLEFAALLAQRELDRAQDAARRPDADHLAASASLLDTLTGVIHHLEPALQAALERLVPRRSDERAA
jgi:hypothetical protein